MITKLTFPNGRTYISHDYLTVGDYGGASSGGVANIRMVLEQFEGRVEEWGFRDLYEESQGSPSYYNGSEWEHVLPEQLCLHVTGAYGSETIYLLEGTEETDEILEALENYPYLNDDTVTEVEMEWEKEAWEQYLRSDLTATLPDEHEAEYGGLSMREWVEDMQTDNSIPWRAYQEAMGECNEYPVPECSGVYVNVDRIAKAFEQCLRRIRLKDEALAAGQMELPI